MTIEQDQRLVADIRREGSRLSRYIRRHVIDRDEAEEILQDVFCDLIETYRLMKPIEQVGAWLFRVARNRIIDRFRRRDREAALPQAEARAADGEPALEDLLPDADAGPEAAFARRILLEEILVALDELPDAQREVFVAHEIEGVSFKQMSESTGTSINTLLARKHDAVRHLRRRLQNVFAEYSNDRGS